MLAYTAFDDSNVEEFHYTKYGSPADPLKVQYPQEIAVKYPKVGTTNPTFQIWVQDLTDPKSNPPKPVQPPPETVAFGEYLYTVADWIDDSKYIIAG